MMRKFQTIAMYIGHSIMFVLLDFAGYVDYPETLRICDSLILHSIIYIDIFSVFVDISLNIILCWLDGLSSIWRVI